jgi:hypothetical protein
MEKQVPAPNVFTVLLAIKHIPGSGVMSHETINNIGSNYGSLKAIAFVNSASFQGIANLH